MYSCPIKCLHMRQVRFGTFDEAARHTAQVMRAPPVEPAESGNDFYTAQPFQVLSWYPRRAPSLPAADAVWRIAMALLESGRLAVSGEQFDWGGHLKCGACLQQRWWKHLAIMQASWPMRSASAHATDQARRRWPS